MPDPGTDTTTPKASQNPTDEEVPGTLGGRQDGRPGGVIHATSPHLWTQYGGGFGNLAFGAVAVFIFIFLFFFQALSCVTNLNIRT